MKNSRYIEYTNLIFNLTSKKIKEFVDLAAKREYRSVVLPFNNVGLAKSYKYKKNYDLKINTVLGYPTDNYNFAYLDTYKDDFEELDIVLPIQAFYYNYPPLLDKIETIINFIKSKLVNEILDAQGKKTYKPLKLIIETSLMRAKPMQIAELCKLAKKCKVDCIVTNTGLIKRKEFKSLIEDIVLIKKNWKQDIKTIGDIKTDEEVQQLIKAGATIVGTLNDVYCHSKEVISDAR